MGSKGGTTVMLPQAQSQTSSVAPNPVALAGYANVVGQAQDLQAQHQGFTPDQQQAFNQVQQLQGVANPWINQAGQFAGQGLAAGNQLIQQGANAGSPQNFGQNINSYMSPYMDDVVRATMANINETNAQQQSQLTGNAIAQGALGGNRVGIAGAELARQQNLTNNSTLAQILQQGYGQAGQNLFQNAGLQMQAGNSLGSLGNQTAGVYSGLGNEQMATGLQGANALLQTGGMQQALPYQQLGWLSGIVNNTGPNMGQTGTQNSVGYTSQYAPSPNPLNSILGAGTAIAGAFARKDGGRVDKAHGGGLGEYDPSSDDYDSPVGGGFGAIPAVKLTGTRGLQLPQFQNLQQPHQTQQQQDRAPSFADDARAGRGLRGAYDRYESGSVADSWQPSSVEAYADAPQWSESRGGRVRGYDEGGAVDDTTPDEGRSAGDIGSILREAHSDPVWQRIVHRESGGQHFNPDGSPKVGGAGEYGIAQIKPATAQEALQSAGLPYDENQVKYDPAWNEGSGYLYYKNQRDRFGSPSLGAAAYNAGPGRVDQALAGRGTIPASTLAYVADVTGQGGLGAINSAAPMSEGRSADAGSGGVAPPEEPGFLESLGVPKISPDTRAALIAAGLGMMASKSHWVGPAIGEGGLAGVKAYYGNQQNTRQNLNTQSEVDYRKGQLGVANQRNRLTAEQLRQSGINIGSEVTTRAGKLGLETRQQDLSEKLTNIRLQAAQAAAEAIRRYSGQSGGLQSSSAPENSGGLQPPTASGLNPSSDPVHLDNLANAYEQGALAAGATGDTQTQDSYLKQAQTFRQNAQTIRQSGKATGSSGETVPLPGSAQTEYQLAGAKSKGEAAGKAPYEIKEVAGPNGETYYKSVADIVDENGKTQATPITSSAGAGTPTSGPPLSPVLAKQPAVMAKRQEAIAANEQKMTDSYQARQIARERYETLAGILSRYQTGKFAENKASMVASLRAAGIPVTNKDTANPAAFEQFTKNAMKNVFSDVHDLGGRVLVAEITGLQRSTANPDLQPEANKAILGQAIGLLNYEDKYHDDYFNWKRQNPYAADTSAFDTEWVKAHPIKEFIKGATSKIGALGEQIPAPEDRQEGQVYSIPANKEKGTKAHQRQWINGRWAPNPYQSNQ